MKFGRTICALATILCVGACAEQMRVINCEEWVSLRTKPDTASERLLKVPLDEYVECMDSYVNGFTYCEYDGVRGYILSDYLESTVASSRISEFEAGEMTVSAWTESDGDHERLIVYGLMPSGRAEWKRTYDVPYVGQCDAFAVFEHLGMVMVYSCEEGLFALDPMDGTTRWAVDQKHIGYLGAGISHCADEEGNLYIGGYFDMDPMKISPEGKALWRADSGDENTYWLYDLTVDGNTLTASYESGKSTVMYSCADGTILETQK